MYDPSAANTSIKSKGTEGDVKSRTAVLDFIKRKGSATIAEIAALAGTTPEAARQQLTRLQGEGWIRRSVAARSTPGRPQHRYELTAAAEHLFPKSYDALAQVLIQTVVDQAGEEGLREILSRLTDAQVASWEEKLAGKSLEERVAMLKGLYFAEDPFTEVIDGDELILVEHNCPYYSVAMEHPRMCSITVSTLTRLLGVRVHRTSRFQTGDGRCAFRVFRNEPVAEGSFRFDFEENSP